MLTRARRAVVVTALLLSLGLVGSTVPALAARETGSGSPVGCASWAFDATNELSGLNLNLMSPATVLSTTLVHPCDGPVHLWGLLNATLTPTVTESALTAFTAQVTCTGGGCVVTGTPISGAPGSGGALTRAKALSTTVGTGPLSATFPDLPAGTYTVEVRALGTHVQLLSGQVHVFGSGSVPPAGRPGPP